MMQNWVGFIGFLSLLQMAFFPGFLLLRAFKLELNLFKVLLFSFALSLTINYVVVAILTSLHCYTPKVLWTLLIIEYLALIYSLARARCNWQSFICTGSEIKAFWQSLDDSPWLLTLFFLALFVLSLFIVHAFLQLGEIFTAWDPVISYNLWAEEWAGDQFPIDSWHYPQAMTATWSLSYVMLQPFTMGVNLQYFPKALMSVFEPMMLCIFLDLALTFRDRVYLIALLLTAYLLKSILGQYLGQGWMDVPVMTLTFMVIYTLLLAVNKPKSAISYLLISAVIASAAASTKQSGLYIAMAYPILAYFLVLPKLVWTKKQKISAIVLLWLIVWIISLPWYGYVEWQIIYAGASSEISFVTNSIYQALDITLWQRFVFGLFSGGFVFWLLFAFSLFGVFRLNATNRIIALLGIIYSLIWLAFYAYDPRNLAISIPFVATSAAFVLQANIWGYACKIWHKFKGHFAFWPPLLYWLLILTSALIILSSPTFSLSQLINKQIKAQTQLGDATLDSTLLWYAKNPGFFGKIMTSWDYLAHIPGLSQYYQPYRPLGVEANRFQSAWMINPQEFKSVLSAYPAKYILVANYGDLVSAAYLNYFQMLLSKQQLKVLIQLPKYTVYEIRVPGEKLAPY